MRVLFAAAAVTFCRPISEGGVEWSEAKWTGIMHSYDDGHEERNERARERVESDDEAADLVAGCGGGCSGRSCSRASATT